MTALSLWLKQALYPPRAAAVGASHAPALLTEAGDGLLLETGDRILTE